MSFKYFTREEFACQETGENEIQDSFVNLLDVLRDTCGYRSPNHSIEAKKAEPGTHAQGIAADIAVNGGGQRHIIVKNAMALGFTGIGVAKTFIHVDTRKTTPVVWIY
jgi:zinc D-Ala-D-Ala carboxypeptidase